MSKQVVMTSVAPGEWKYAENPDRSLRVDLTFPGVADASALRAQIDAWLEAMERCVDRDAALGERAALLIPSEGDGSPAEPPVLHYPAPMKIGAAILPVKPKPSDVLSVLRRIAGALDSLHARGFIHGALGMSSLWWMEDGTLRFADAGLTHILDGVLRPPKVAGAYLAPEIWRRSGIMPASDQYGLAAIAFELFTGNGRFVEDETNGVQSVQPLTLEAGARLYDGAPAELNDVMQRALSTSPSSRFGSCMEFVEALEGHTTAAKSLPTVHGFAGFKGGFSKQTAVLVAATIVVLGGSAYVMRAGVKQRAIGGVDFDFGGVAYAAREKANTLPNIDVRTSGPSLPSRSTGSGGDASASTSGGSAGGGRSSGSASGTSGGGGESQPASSGSRAAAPTPAAAAIKSQAAALARDVKRAVTANEVASPPAYSTQGSSSPSSSGNAPSSTSGGTSGGGATPSSGSSGSGSTGGSAANTSRGTSGGDGSTSRVTSGGASSTRTASTSTGTTTTRTSTVTTVAADTGVVRTTGPAKEPTGSALSEWVGKVVGGTQTPQAPRASGALQLNGPSRARYYVDGVLVRPVRGMVTTTEGEHDVDMVIPNGSIYRRRVTVLGGQTVVVKQ